jgi:hypothetical protein
MLAAAERKRKMMISACYRYRSSEAGWVMLSMYVCFTGKQAVTHVA